jgi:glutathione peroxidase
MSVYDLALVGLDGSPFDTERLRGKATLVVNVASKCGLTPQYAGLERLYERHKERGLVVLGVPCNQFGGQEPGQAAEIAEFCSLTYDVTFPLLEKVDVNGEGRHPLYDRLTVIPDADGVAGDVAWNFEKFLVSPDGEPVARFRSSVDPEGEEIESALEPLLR